jgi:hypothetical protein
MTTRFAPVVVRTQTVVSPCSADAIHLDEINTGCNQYASQPEVEAFATAFDWSRRLLVLYQLQILDPRLNSFGEEFRAHVTAIPCFMCALQTKPMS